MILVLVLVTLVPVLVSVLEVLATSLTGNHNDVISRSVKTASKSRKVLVMKKVTEETKSVSTFQKTVDLVITRRLLSVEIMLRSFPVRRKNAYSSRTVLVMNKVTEEH